MCEKRNKKEKIVLDEASNFETSKFIYNLF